MARKTLFRRTSPRQDSKKPKLKDELRAKNIDLLTPGLLLSALHTDETRTLHTGLLKKIERNRGTKEDVFRKMTFRKLIDNHSDHAKELVAFALDACNKIENTKAMERVKEWNTELHAQGLSDQINRISVRASIGAVVLGSATTIALLGAGFSNVISGIGGVTVAAVIFASALYITNKLDLKTRDLYMRQYGPPRVKQT